MIDTKNKEIVHDIPVNLSSTEIACKHFFVLVSLEANQGFIAQSTNIRKINLGLCYHFIVL